MGSSGPNLDLNDDATQRTLIGRPQPQQPVTLRGLTLPNSAPAATSTPAASTPTAASSEPTAAGPTKEIPPAISPLAKQTAKDRETQAELSKGSGISQIGNPWARAALRGLNIAGEIATPGLMARIPGTEEHNQALIAKNTAALNTDEEQAEKQAQTANLNAQPELKRAALDLKEQQQNEQAEKNQNTLNEQYRKLGLKLDPTTHQPVAIPYAELTPQEQAVHDLKAAQTEAAEARAELDKAKGNPNSDLYKMQQKRLEIAEQNAKNATARLGLSTEEFANKVHEQGLIKPSGQAQSRASAADAALAVLPELEQQIRDNAEDLGLIMGRIQRGEIAIGDVDPKINKLYSTMQSFYAMQPAIHGFRNAEFVKDFNSFVGGLERDPEATLAGLEGLKPTMQSIAKEGKTFHKRIVEGEENNAGENKTVKPKDYGAAPAGKAEGSTGKLDDGTKVVVKGGRLVAQ